MPDLLRYQALAVLQYSFTPDALYLRHPRQLQNLGEKLKLKVPHKISRKANWMLFNFVSTRSGLELKVPSDYAVLNTLLLF